MVIVHNCTCSAWSIPCKQAKDYQLKHEEEEAAMDALAAQAALTDQVENEKAKADEMKQKSKGASC